MAALSQGGQTDLGLAREPETAIAEKLFAGPLSLCDDWCALERPRLGLRIRFRFSPAATPFLECGSVTAVGPDARAQTVLRYPGAVHHGLRLAGPTGPWSRVLAPGQSFSWPMIVEIESI